MAKFSGFVAKVGLLESKPGAKRAWKLYSVLLEKEDGTTHPWISLGFRDDPPKIKEGEYVTLDAENDDQNRLVYVEGTAQKPKNPPARAAKAPAQSGGGFKGKGGGGGFQPRVRDGKGVNDRTNPEDAKRMTWANASDRAVAMVKLLLDNKALPVAGSQGKAGEATRFDQIRAAVDKLAVEYYNDALTLRKLSTVADAGVVDTGPDGSIPADKAQHDIDAEQPDAGDQPNDDSGDSESDDVI